MELSCLPVMVFAYAKTHASLRHAAQLGVSWTPSARREEMEDRFKIILSDFIINFGMIETDLRIIIKLIITKKLDQNEKMKLNYILNKIMASNDSIGFVTDLLKIVIYKYITEPNKYLWLEAINDIHRISKYRNIYIHGMWGYDFEDDSIIKMKLQKNNHEQLYEELVIHEQEIMKMNGELYNRHRQMMDFIESETNETKIKSQYEYVDLAY